MNITAAGAVDREFVYIEMENLFLPLLCASSFLQPYSLFFFSLFFLFLYLSLLINLAQPLANIALH